MAHGEYAKAKNNGARAPQGPMVGLIQVPNLETAASYHCPNCMCNVFQDAVRIWEVSALISPTGQAQPGRQQVLRCMVCGGVWDQAQLKKLSAPERQDLVAKVAEMAKIRQAAQEERQQAGAEVGQ